MATSNREYGAFYPTSASNARGSSIMQSPSGKNKNNMFSIVDSGASTQSMGAGGGRSLGSSGKNSASGGGHDKPGARVEGSYMSAGGSSGRNMLPSTKHSSDQFSSHTPLRSKPVHGPSNTSHGSSGGLRYSASPKSFSASRKFTEPGGLGIDANLSRNFSEPGRSGSGGGGRGAGGGTMSSSSPSVTAPRLASFTATPPSPKVGVMSSSGRFSSSSNSMWPQQPSPKGGSSQGMNGPPRVPGGRQSVSQVATGPTAHSSLSQSMRNVTLPPGGNRLGSGTRTLPKMGSGDQDDAASMASVAIYGYQSVGGVSPGFFKENQDECMVIKRPFSDASASASASKKDFFAAVMDGHGLAGKHVSHFVKNNLMQDEFHRRLTSTDPSEALSWAYNKTATELKKSGVDHRESGSTAVSCLRRGNDLICANVGDSRCVMGRMDGGDMKAIALSRDHKPQRKDEMERIHRLRGHVEPSRAYGGRFVGPARVWAVKQQVGGLAVSRAIGDTNLNSVGVIPVPEIMKETVTPNDKFLILASDGVWEHLTSQDAVNIAKIHYNDPKKASEALVAKAREAWSKEKCGYRDDITAVVVKLD